ncbi:TPA: YfhO family protein [Streptococcus pneumoniae]
MVLLLEQSVPLLLSYYLESIITDESHHDKGWSAYQDGKKIEIKQAQTGFMKVDIPKGKGTITLSFIPNGFITGAICSFTSLLLFGIYNHRRKSSKA